MLTTKSMNFLQGQLAMSSFDPKLNCIELAIMYGKFNTSIVHFKNWHVRFSGSYFCPILSQVMEETKVLFDSYKIKCSYRGPIQVKGKGEILTFFIVPDQDIHSTSLRAPL